MTAKLTIGREAEVVEALSNHTPTQAIAKNLGISPTTVQRVKNDHRELIEQASRQLIQECLHRIVQQTSNEVQEGAALSVKLLQILKDGSQAINVGDEDNPNYVELFPKEYVDALNKLLVRIDKKHELMLKSVGLYPSHAPSMVINNTVFNDNRTEVSAIVMGLLSSQGDTDLPDGVVIDV